MMAEDLLTTTDRKTTILQSSTGRTDGPGREVQALTAFGTRGRAAYGCRPAIGHQEKKDQDSEGTQQICFD